MPAGRPRHQDVLTPREWQVLDLLRRGLTNDQIASQLAISADTAKFHVSEILTKLGVQTRQEAAAWQGQPRRVFTLAPLAALLRKSNAHQLAGVGVAAGVAAVLLLATGIALMNARDRDPQTSVAPTAVPGEERFAPDGRTGIAEVDAAIDALLHDDGDALNRAFSGITASEELRIQAEAPGSYTTDTLEVTAARWTARLAAARKSL
jgi:DNA-binding CsgD family transcriptional regulator